MTASDSPSAENAFEEARRHMVANQLRGRKITDPAVLDAFAAVPRHRFVPPELQDQAYDDRPLSIGRGQTISQPYVVAYMLELAHLQAGDRVLDCGGGSGYQAALLAAMGCDVLSVEIVPELAEAEAKVLAELGYENVRVKAGDCVEAVVGEELFDAILVAAAPARVPQQLIDHLALGGRLVMPVGLHNQELVVIAKGEQGHVERFSHGHVSFVPFTGKHA